MATKCTAAQAVAAMEYWLGYYEKATSTYAAYRDKAYFEKDKGSNNYTYPGYYCGIQGGAWCAMLVSTAIAEACGCSKGSNDMAKTVLHGLWPYSSCNQLYDAAPAASKGRRGSWTPQAGDVIVFCSGSTRTHTGMVYAADSSKVYTIEGNTSNMCAKRSYSLTDSSIYGYVRPAYADASTSGTSSSGSTTSSTASNIKTFQTWLNTNYKTGLSVDGVYGNLTKKAAIKAWQTAMNAAHSTGLVVDGIFGTLCKAAATKYPVKSGATGVLAYIVQGMLYCHGYDPSGFDGIYGANTAAAVKKFQAANSLTQDGIAGVNTFTKLFA